jgi:hypothetical protein
MNLFKKIWTKNFLKAKEPIDKFSEDIGGLKGEFSWIKYKDGKKIDNFTYHNDITDLSKSTVIRLLSQGTSSWNGLIDPTQYKISKMRFGNAPWNDHNSDLPLCYYDLSESVYRDNLTNPTNAEYSPAGGRYLEGSNSTPTGVINSGSNSQISLTKQPSDFSNWGQNALIGINITSNFFSTPGNTIQLIEKRPPSHKTLLIELLSVSGSVLASLTFNSIYSRDTDGNEPTSINMGSNYLFSSDHKLYYDYTASIWKIQFKLGSGVISNITSVRISFKTGAYNIANSIVPKIGYNLGSGTAINRFPLSGGIDYYSISNLAYSDSVASSFVDDYKVTFSIPMAQSEGNGVFSGIGTPVLYTEAFLFNARDDLFSIIRFPPEITQGISKVGFSKDSTVAYFISWTIKSIL